MLVARAYLYPEHQHLPLYLTHLLTYLYKQASSVSSIRVSVRGLCLCARALTSLTNYLLCHEILEIVFVLGWCYWCVYVCVVVYLKKELLF